MKFAQSIILSTLLGAAIAEPFLSIDTYMDENCSASAGNYLIESKQFMTVILSSIGGGSNNSNELAAIKYISDNLSCSFLDSLIPTLASADFAALGAAQTSSYSALFAIAGGAAQNRGKCTFIPDVGAYAIYQCSETEPYTVPDTPDEFVYVSTYSGSNCSGYNILNATIPSVGFQNPAYSALTQNQFFCSNGALYTTINPNATVIITDTSNYMQVPAGTCFDNTPSVRIECAPGLANKEIPPIKGFGMNLVLGSSEIPGDLTISSSDSSSGAAFYSSFPITSFYPPYNGVGTIWFVSVPSEGTLSWAYNDTYISEIGYDPKELVFVSFNRTNRLWQITETEHDADQKTISVVNVDLNSVDWTIVAKSPHQNAAFILSPSFALMALTVVVSSMLMM